MSEPRTPVVTGPQRFDRCEVVRKLHSGPVAELFEARQLPLGRPVLVKALRTTILPSSPFAMSLEREARLLSDLSHSNVIRLYDYVKLDEAMWLVLEYIDGFTLHEVIARGSLPEAAAVAIALQMARGLAHAHQHEIVHRDIQPANVLVARSGRVKLTNFATASDGRLPTAPEPLQVEEGFGSPLYLSPEQVLGEGTDARSDIFALGMVFFEMLAGRSPFEPSGRSTPTLRIVQAQPLSLARLAPGVSPRVERLVGRCLEKVPSDRFGSSAELVQALEGAARELGFSDPEPAVVAGLAHAGLTERSSPRERARAQRPRRERRTALARAVAGQLVALGALSAGGIALHQRYGAELEERQHRSGESLELRPRHAAYLRVVADPWAHVFVEGQHVATTPFAEPIPLAPGVHYIRLEHPNAAAEERTLRLAAGETRLLDVTLQVVRPEAPAAPTAHEPAPEGP